MSESRWMVPMLAKQMTMRTAQLAERGVPTGTSTVRTIGWSRNNDR